LGEAATKGEDLNSLFCSELCAALLKHGQVMDKERERDSNAYSPKDFSSASNASLTTAYPWEFKTEQQVLTKISSHETEIEARHAQTQGSSKTDSGDKISDILAKSPSKEDHTIAIQRMALEHFIKQCEANVAAADIQGDAVKANEAQANLDEAKKQLAALPAPSFAAAKPSVLTAGTADTAAPKEPQEASVTVATAPVGQVDPARSPEERDKQSAGCCR